MFVRQIRTNFYSCDDICLRQLLRFKPTNAHNFIKITISLLNTNSHMFRALLVRHQGAYKCILQLFYTIQYIHTHTHTGCPRRKGPNFGRVFLRSNYTDITQTTYIQSSMVTEILNIEKRGLVWCLRTVLCP